jgi:hypothetical protein
LIQNVDNLLGIIAQRLMRTSLVKWTFIHAKTIKDFTCPPVSGYPKTLACAK